MRTLARPRAAAIAFAVLVLALGACGGGDDGGTASSSTAATTGAAAGGSSIAACSVDTSASTAADCLAPITTDAAGATEPDASVAAATEGAASTAGTATTDAAASDAAVTTDAGGSATADPAMLAALELIDGIPQDGLVLGDPEAPARLHVFEDLQCPFCKQWEEEGLPGVIDRVRAGELAIEFRALAFLGPDSLTGARTVIAAGEQDHAWDMVLALYAAQGAENSGWLTDAVVAAAAASIPGLDLDQLLADRDGAAVDDELARTERHASQIGVQGTPSFALQSDGGPLKKVEVTGLGPDGLDGVLPTSA